MFEARRLPQLSRPRPVAAICKGAANMGAAVGPATLISADAIAADATASAFPRAKQFYGWHDYLDSHRLPKAIPAT